MPSLRDMRLRIGSIRNLSQVTRALETVSTSKIRRAMSTLNATQPYAEKAWKVVIHLARQPGHTSLHPLLTERKEIKKILVVLISSDRGLAGALNVNIYRETIRRFKAMGIPYDFVSVGRKGRELLQRGGMKIIADFPGLAFSPSYSNISAIGRLVVEGIRKEGLRSNIYRLHSFPYHPQAIAGNQKDIAAYRRLWHRRRTL